MIIIQIISHYPIITKEAVSHYIPVLYCDTLMGLDFNPTLLC